MQEHLIKRFAAEIAFQQVFICIANDLDHRFPIGQHHRFIGKQTADLPHHAIHIRALTIGLVEKQDDRHSLLAHRGEQHLGLGLHTLDRTDNKDRRVQCPQRAFHLGGKIDVTGGVDQVHLYALPIERDAGSLDRDPSSALYGQCIGVCRPAVDTAGRADRTCMREELLRKGCFAGIDMRQYADGDFLFHILPPFVRSKLFDIIS